MGALLRSIDWAQTPLGPSAGWSRELRVTVGLVLRSGFPMLVWWGPKFVQIYNDAFRPVCGAKHPQSFGMSGPECWAEIWNVVGPMIEGSYHGKPASWSDDLELLIDRNGFFEECHFHVAYSPLPDETSPTGMGGVHCTADEITTQAYGDRQFRTLRDLAASVAKALTADDVCRAAAESLKENVHDVPFALLYLVDESGQMGRLAGACGFDAADHPAAPRSVTLGEDASTSWPLAAVVRERRTQVIENLAGRFGKLPTGKWTEQPTVAVALPLTSPGQPHAYGVLIIGGSPHRAMEQRYLGFFELAAAQITTGLRNAAAYQEERRRAEMRAELDRAKTTFFSNVSHEFRTPLMLMLGPAEDILGGAQGELTAPQREQIVLLHRNALRLYKLVNTLLDFSRIEAERIQVSYERVDLAALTRDLASAFRSVVEKSGLTYTVNCDSLADDFYVDRDMWEKIVLNLLSNAFKFTFAGGIEVSLGRSVGGVKLRVRDTGVGISEREMPRLFERFHRVESAKARTHEGSGIGLSLVQELVKLHLGTIEAESQPGIGTTFTVFIRAGFAHLPAAKIKVASASAPASVDARAYVEEALRWIPGGPQPESDRAAARESFELSETQGARILLADDNADMREYLVHLLSRYWTVECVNDGAEALIAAKARPPELVLTDVMMPVRDGFGLLKELRADPALKEIPVIVLSARAGIEASVEGLNAGADDYLIKPFSAHELTARVQTHLRQARIRRAAKDVLLHRTDQYETLLNKAPMGIFLIDSEFHIRQANPIAVAVFGPIPDLIGREFEAVLRVLWQPETVDDILLRFRRTLETGKPDFLAGFSAHRRDRDIAESYEWQINRIVLPEGIPGVVCYFRDISAQLKAQAIADAAERLSATAEALQAHNVELEGKVAERTHELSAANHEMEGFCYSIAHDLRAPLRSIDSFSRLVLDEFADKLEEEGKGYLRRVRAASGRMNEVIEGMLMLARLSRNPLRLELVDLSAQAHEIITELKRTHPGRGCDVIIEPGVSVQGDPALLRVVLQNLLDNAWKFTGKTAAARIEFGMRRETDRHVYFVRDNGAGFEMKTGRKLFDTFERLHAEADFPGTGIGLATVRRIIQRQGGKVWAEAAPQKGATFYFTLPATDYATTT